MNPEQAIGRAVAEAFDLGAVTRVATHQFSVSRTWRLETVRGVWLAKQLWTGDDPFWAGELPERMALEAYAAASGIAVPTAAAPRVPAYGSAGRVPGHGVFRVFGWVDGALAGPDAPIEAWAGRTAAVLHGWRPSSGADGPRYYGLHDAAVWQGWADLAAARQRSWAPELAARLDGLLAVTARLGTAYATAADWVITHGDLAPRNVLVADVGPVLIDWDSVGTESASHELGDVAFRFSGGDPARARRVLDAYAAAGGTLPEVEADWVVRPIGRRLADLAALVRAEVEGHAESGWMTDDADGRITAWLADFEAYVARVDRFAAAL